jgi:hypothetical protein
MEKFYENIDFSTSNNFRIDVRGKLDKDLSDIFGGLSISHKTDGDNVISLLEGEVIDQACLIGILNTLFNMRFPIINLTIN